MDDPANTIKEIIEARDAMRKARKDAKCTCGGFILQYEGSCQCGSGRESVLVSD